MIVVALQFFIHGAVIMRTNDLADIRDEGLLNELLLRNFVKVAPEGSVTNNIYLPEQEE